MDGKGTSLQESRQDAERALAEAEARLRCLVEWVSDGYLLYDTGGSLLDANPSACNVLGYERSDLGGRGVCDVLEGSGLTDLDEPLRDGKPRALEATGRRKDGTSFPARVTLGLVEDGGLPMFMALIHDLTEENSSRERIEYLSGHDALTGLLNKERFTAHVDDSIDRAERGRRQVSVLHVNLNRFSLINEGLGFEGGDELLRQTASRLREAIRPMDLLARLSADEFLILASDLGREGAAEGGGAGVVAADEAQAIAEGVHRALEQPYDIDGREVYASAAVGLSLYPLDADSTRVLLRHACAAAHQAKRPGEEPTLFHDGDTTDRWERLSLAVRLRKAVETAQLVVHYQPIVDLEQGRTVAAEALARWHDRDDLVPAARFIPVAEDLGLIDSIGEWVINEACRQAVVWHERGHSLDIAVNLSLQELWRDGLAERIAQQIASIGLPPQSLTVEVTESSAMTDPVRTKKVLSSLRSQGLTLALDDFGTGHSSLARLAELPFQVLKIDRSFTARVPGDPSSAAMVTAMVDLARRLGMRAVAEGIETEEQLAFLRELGCPLGQGFLFGRPAAAEELPLS